MTRSSRGSRHRVEDLSVLQNQGGRFLQVTPSGVQLRNGAAVRDVQLAVLGQTQGAGLCAVGRQPATQFVALVAQPQDPPEQVTALQT